MIDFHRFERELEALRKELAEAAASRSGAITPAEEDGSTHSRASSEDNDNEIDNEIDNATEGTDSPVFVAQELAPQDLDPTPVSALDGSADSSESLDTPETPLDVKKNQ